MSRKFWAGDGRGFGSYLFTYDGDRMEREAHIQRRERERDRHTQPKGTSLIIHEHLCLLLVPVNK